MNEQQVVFVVDDDQAVRDSLKLLLRSAELPVVTFDSAKAFVEACARDCRGCVLLDVQMPGMSGLEVQECLNARGIMLPVIILTGYGNVPMAVRALKAGALDFIEKPFDGDVLLNRVRQALKIDEEQFCALEQRQDWLQRAAGLTGREREVMGGIVSGKANKVIALDMGISMRTVEVHRAHVMEKMGVRSLAELVQAAMAVGVGSEAVLNPDLGQ